MKCPECATANKRKDGLRCSKCGYAFSFDPKSDGISDPKFRALLRSASANDTYYFTMNQLYGAWCQKQSPISGGGCAFIAAILGWIASGVFLFLGVGTFLTDTLIVAIPCFVLSPIALVVATIIFFVSRSGPKAPDRAKLEQWVHKWVASGKPIPFLLRAPSLDQAPAPYRERDIYDYGVERVIIVEHDLLVDLLVKNNVHTAEKALVISERGYPGYLTAHFRRLQAERADLPIILLHDSTPTGLGMRERLLRNGVISQYSRVIDAGITPAEASRITSLQKTVPAATKNAVPIDYLPVGAIAGGLAGVVAGGLLLAPAIAAAQAAPGSADSGGSSFG